MGMLLLCPLTNETSKFNAKLVYFLADESAGIDKTKIESCNASEVSYPVFISSFVRLWLGENTRRIELRKLRQPSS